MSIDLPESDNKKISVLMVGVDEGRTGGMWSVAKVYMDSPMYKKYVNLKYIATSTSGSIVKRIFKMLEGYLKIVNTFRDESIDLVHIHMAEKGSVYRKGLVAWYAKRKKAKLIIHIHAGPFMEWYSTLSDRRKIRVKKLFSLADAVVVLGKYWKEQLAQIVEESKISVIYNGVDVYEENTYLANCNDILFMGRINEAKGIWEFLDAIEMINEKLPKSIKVNICGTDETGKLQDAICKHNLEERIKFQGWVNEKQREEMYKSTMMLVLPSHIEALSMTVLEAMARGIPVVTTNITTMPEILKDVVPLVEVGNAEALSKVILRLAFSNEDRMQISKKEFSLIQEKFSAKKMIENTLTLYRETFPATKPLKQLIS